MSDYDIFAKFYDPVMGDRNDVINIVRDLIDRHNPHGKTMLELGCGTGSLLAGFTTQFELSGIDQSSQMLQIAQQKLPKSHFIHGTIAGFKLNNSFDVIICLFDTINHLLSLEDWQKTFTSVKNHLGANGLFIFDMNTIGRMQALATMPTYTQDFNGNTMDMTIEPVSPQEVTWHITVQEPQPDGLIQVYEEQVNEISFPLRTVKQALEQSGFKILEAFDSDHRHPTDQSDRIYFACQSR